VNVQGVLGKPSIEERLRVDPPIVERMRDPSTQVQPNGVDLTIEAVLRLDSRGALGNSVQGRKLPERTLVEADPDGWYHLAPGPYVIVIHEPLNMPLDLMALAWPRSSLLRCGAQLGTAVIDAGYRGQLEALLMVENPLGLDLGSEAGICQIVFFPLAEEVEGYSGRYQGKLFSD
jgi:dUTP pyrophosphatase